MDTVYKSKIDWWIPAVVAVTVGVAFIGPIIDGEIFIVGIIIAVLLGTLEIVMFASVKYKSVYEFNLMKYLERKIGLFQAFIRSLWNPITRSFKLETCSILRSNYFHQLIPNTF